MIKWLFFQQIEPQMGYFLAIGGIFFDEIEKDFAQYA